MDAGNSALPGRVLVMRSDGSVYVCDSATVGWTRYGQGNPAIPSGVGYVGVAMGADSLPGYAYVVSEDGKTYVTDSAVTGWTSYGQGVPSLPGSGGHSSVTGDGSAIYLLGLEGTVHKSIDSGDSWSTFGGR